MKQGDELIFDFMEAEVRHCAQSSPPFDPILS
jgi:hypothetical protein